MELIQANNFTGVPNRIDKLKENIVEATKRSEEQRLAKQEAEANQSEQEAKIAAKELARLEEIGQRSGIGDLLVNDYVLPFEVASVLLLAAIVGALVLVRER